METKALLFGIIGFLLGGLVVSVAATTGLGGDHGATEEMTMSEMTDELSAKTGDKYDAAFLASMIEHHQSALAMARLSADRAEHDEIKQLSREIIEAQQHEIATMRQWQRDWGYHSGHSMP